ncbi:MAG: hypothetical protein Q9217_004272 [Psora testacea]
MSARLPTTTDFPPQLHLTIIPPSPTSLRPSNVLIFLHGLGDTSEPFTKFGKQLKLPETVCISLQAPTPLPFDLGGFHWGDGITFNQATGQMDLDGGFKKAIRMIKLDVIEQTIIKKCGYRCREVVVFGLGQGGMAAIATALSIHEELGGVISVGGPLPQSHSLKYGASTPLLLLGSSSNTAITHTALERLRLAFTCVEDHTWQRSGDCMPMDYNEMLPIMAFFARRLRSRQGVPEGSIEVG